MLRSMGTWVLEVTPSFGLNSTGGFGAHCDLVPIGIASADPAGSWTGQMPIAGMT